MLFAYVHNAHKARRDACGPDSVCAQARLSTDHLEIRFRRYLYAQLAPCSQPFVELEETRLAEYLLMHHKQLNITKAKGLCSTEHSRLLRPGRVRYRRL